MTAAAGANPAAGGAPDAGPAPNPLRENRLNSSSDYRPDWDVPDLNRHVSDSIVQGILQAREENRTEPDPAQLMDVVLAQPGYGKTHLFGRLGHLLGDRVLFVFVPAIEDPERPLEHVRWHLVESLFRPKPPRHAPIVVAMARLCYPSFRQYVSRFPPAMKQRHRDLVRGFETAGADGTKMLEVVGAVKSAEPFLTLARSMAACTPELPGPVVRAMALGWSPAADSARRWLRGETLPEEELGRLDLPRESPRPQDVLRAVPLLTRHRVPVVLCLDQIESVLSHPSGPRILSTRLMEVLQTVPNLFIVLSCLESEWPEFLNKAFVAARQRFRDPPLKMEAIDGQQAVDLVANRLKGWPGAQPRPGRVWPFDEAAIVRYADEKFPSPRALIQRCADRFDPWLESGREGLIDVTAPGRKPLPAAEVFRREWDREMEAIRSDPRRSPAHVQDQRLHRAVGQALGLARDAGWSFGGLRVAEVNVDAIPQVGADKVYSFAVRMAPAPQAGAAAAPEPGVSVVVPVTKVDNGYRFVYYLKAVGEAVAGGFTACLLVHEKARFGMGKATAAAFEKLREGRKLWLFALSEHPETFRRLECALTLLDKAAGGELQFDGRVVTPAECRDLLGRIKVLQGLDLFESLAAAAGGT